MDFLSNLIQHFIKILYDFTGSIGEPSYGLAIILMTVVIKIILFPLTKKQIESTKAMMDIQPRMKEIQRKYKDDKMRMNEELAKLYKEANVNPLAGCLPLLIQMPILFSIYYGVRDFTYEGPASFLWMESIAEPDKLFILPILSAITTFISAKQTMNESSGAQGKVMLYFMPLMIGYMSLQFPAGMVIYWVVMNIMQIAQQGYMNSLQAKAKK